MLRVRRARRAAGRGSRPPPSCCAPGHKLTADELRAHCADHLSRHKIPRYIWFLTEPLPRNANGKFLKRELRETLKLEQAA